MAYGLYKRIGIKKIDGDSTRSAHLAYKGLIVWDDTKTGLKKWIKKWGNKRQKKYL